MSGQPLFEVSDTKGLERPMTAERILEEERQALLDEGDFNEYRVSYIFIIVTKGAYIFMKMICY